MTRLYLLAATIFFVAAILITGVVVVGFLATAIAAIIQTR